MKNLKRARICVTATRMKLILSSDWLAEEKFGESKPYWLNGDTYHSSEDSKPRGKCNLLARIIDNRNIKLEQTNFLGAIEQ